MRCFRGGPFRTVAVLRAGGSGGNRVRGMEGLALDLVTCRPRDFGHARQPPWASFSSDGRSGGWAMSRSHPASGVLTLTVFL